MTLLLTLNILIICHCFFRPSLGQDSAPGSLYHFCNETILEGQGILLSPNFPQKYNASSFCRWQIRVENDRNIMLSFRHFDVETSGNCAYDRVSVYNGPSESHPLLGKFCGSFKPSNVLSTSNRMLVTLKTDDGIQKSGFLAVFLSVAAQPAELNSCGGLMTGNEGSFHSVNFPKSNYPNSLTCSWHIRTQEGRGIVLRFGKLTLEESNDCKYDAITVYSGWSNNDETRFMGRYCKRSDTPDEIVSPGNEMFITFATDSSGNDVGFSATYTTRMTSLPDATEIIPEGKPDSTDEASSICPETVVLRTDSGSIFSPGYKESGGYQPNLRCSWRIQTSPGSRILLLFENFELERDNDCIFDYVLVYSGSDADGTEIGRYCGNMENREVRSDSNEMFVLFASDSGGNANGFRASYSTVASQQPETTTTASTTTTTTTRTRVVSTTPALPVSPTTTTESVVSSCLQGCGEQVQLLAKACSAMFVASVKVVSVQTLPSGTVRARVSLMKMLKLREAVVSMRKKAKFWLDVSCANCFPALKRKSKYIIAGTELSRAGGQLDSSDSIEKFSKKTQRILKKAVRRCRRGRRSRRRKRGHGRKKKNA